MAVFCSQEEFLSLLGEISDKVEYIRMQVKGGSMYPFIRSGEWVKLEPASNCRNIKKGEMILFSKEGNIYAHRVVNKREDFVIAKGDLSFGNEGNIPIDDVLAKIVSVQRNGRDILLNSGLNRFIGIFMADFGFILQYIFLAIRKIIGLAVVLISFIQGLKVCRRLMKELSKDILVREAESFDKEQLRDLYLVNMQDIEVGLVGDKKSGFWLIAQKKEKIAGALAISFHEQNGKLWLLNGLIVKILYRGLGIGERLVKEVIVKGRAVGIRKIILFVNKKSKAALSLYKKLGFKISFDYPLEFNVGSDELYLLYEF